MSRVAELALSSLLLAYTTSACTVIAVGKDASASGVPIVTHNDDSGATTTDTRLVRVPRQRWPKGSMRPLYVWQIPYPRVVSNSLGAAYAPANGQQVNEPIAYIPQVEETWAYWDMDYGTQNEWGLSIGESTSTGMTVGWVPSPDNPYGHCHVGIDDLSKIALERCKTARCAVQTMGDIAVEQGFFSADAGTPDKPLYGGSGEALVVADAELGELWIFNVLTGKNNASAIWAAQRVPSNHVVGIGNSFTIRALDLNDRENNLYSANVTELAKEKGWWCASEAVIPGTFDFFSAYGYQPRNGGYPWDPPQVDKMLAYYSGRRMWRIFNLLSPGEGAKLDPNIGNLPKTRNSYPPSVPAPKGSVTLRMVMGAMRDHYEGTPYDLTKGIAAGPFGNPNRGHGPPTVLGQWERAISMYRTAFSFVLEARPRGRSVTWFGYDAPHGTVWLPFFGAATRGAPEAYSSSLNNMSTFNHKSAWWAFNLVNQYSDTNFKLINAEVVAKSNLINAEAAQKLAEWEESLGTDTASMDLLTERSNDFAKAKVAEWWAFAWHLIGKYGRFVVTHNESAVNGVDAVSTLYPEWWLRRPDVGYATWMPNGSSAETPLISCGEGAVMTSLLPAAGAASKLDPSSAFFGVAALLGASFAVYTAGVRHGRHQALVQEVPTCYSRIDP